MENKEKYYTPDETEFSIGFDYEEKYGEKWYKTQYYPSDFLDYDQNFIFEKSRIRVKYLDSEDLRKLGFTEIKGNFHLPVKSKYHNHAEIKIRLNGNNNIDIDFNCEDWESCYNIDNVHVKNKFELKRLIETLYERK